jgi:hypothetical protein
MRRVLFTCASGFLALTVSAFAQTPRPSSPDNTPPSVNQRIENQRDRIQAGTRDDQLTKRERTRLRAGDAAIRAQERVDRRANHGTLTKSERRQLNRELNRHSRRIHRHRYNHRKPKP